MQQDVQAIEWARRTLAAQNVWPIPRLWLAAALAQNGEEAAQTLPLAPRHQNQEHPGANRVAMVVVPRHSPLGSLRQTVIRRSAPRWHAGGVIDIDKPVGVLTMPTPPTTPSLPSDRACRSPQ
jgi:hypothetical protein